MVDETRGSQLGARPSWSATAGHAQCEALLPTRRRRTDASSATPHGGGNGEAQVSSRELSPPVAGTTGWRSRR